MVRILSTAEDGFEADFQALLGAKREQDQDVNDIVSEILSDVRKRGDAALIDYTSKFDRFDLNGETLAFTADEIASARAVCDPDTLAALELAVERIGN